MSVKICTPVLQKNWGLKTLSLVKISSRDHATLRETKDNIPDNPLPFNSVPGFKNVPFLGSLPFLIARKDFEISKIHEFYRIAHEEFGPIFKMTMPFAKMVATKDPDDIEAVHRATQGKPVRLPFQSLKNIRHGEAFFQGKGGLLTENEEEWWRIRKNVQGPMMKMKNITKYLPQMDQISLEFIERISRFQERLGEMPEDFQKEIYKYTLENVAFVAFNRRLGCLREDITKDSAPIQMIQAANEIFDSMWKVETSIPFWKIFPTAPYRKLKNAHAVFLRTAESEIRKTEAGLHSKSSKNDDLTLMEILLCNPVLSRSDVVTLILDMLMAGIDTTSHTLGFTLYLLARNPSTQKLLQKEVDSVIGDGAETINEGHLARMSYLKACVKEALRIFPLAPGTIRQLNEDLILQGYLIPKGVHVMTHNMIAGWEEKWFPKASEYHPERWLRHQPLGPIHPFSSLPFSTGTRMCLGRRIAEQEIHTLLIRIMHRYNIEYHYKDLNMLYRVVIFPSEPLKFKFVERRSS